MEKLYTIEEMKKAFDCGLSITLDAIKKKIKSQRKYLERNIDYDYFLYFIEYDKKSTKKLIDTTIKDSENNFNKLIKSLK